MKRPYSPFLFAIALTAGVTFAPAASAAPACFHPFTGWAVFEGTVAAYQPAATSAQVRKATRALDSAKLRHIRAGKHLRAVRATIRESPTHKSHAPTRRVQQATKELTVTRARVKRTRTTLTNLRARTQPRYRIAATGGRTGSGHVGTERFQFDTPCHFRALTGHPLEQSSGVSLIVRTTRATAISSVTRQLPEAGDRVTVTLSGLSGMNPTALKSGAVRSLANWSQ